VLQAGSLLAADLAPEVTVTTLLLEEPPAMALLSMLDMAEMAVVGSRGLGGFSELMVGSTSLKLATHAPCTVVVVSARTVVGEPGPTAGRVVGGLNIDEPGADGILASASRRRLGATSD